MNVGSLNGFSASFDDRVLIQRLRWLGGTALPDTVAATLNSIAGSVEKNAKSRAKKSLTIRTKYSINGIKQDRRAFGKNVDRMFARVRIRSKYMAIQNTGGTIRAQGSAYPIATVASRRGMNYAGIVAGRYRLSSNRNFRKHPYFVGKPRHGNRPAGIWERRPGNRLRLIRRFGHRSVDVPGTKFFDDAIATFTRPGMRRAIFSEIARAKLRRMPR